MTKRISHPGVREGYDRWSASYDSTPNPVVSLDRRHTLTALDPRPGEWILDAGCGTGAHLRDVGEASARAVLLLRHAQGLTAHRTRRRAAAGRSQPPTSHSTRPLRCAGHGAGLRASDRSSDLFPRGIRGASRRRAIDLLGLSSGARPLLASRPTSNSTEPNFAWVPSATRSRSISTASRTRDFVLCATTNTPSTRHWWRKFRQPRNTSSSRCCSSWKRNGPDARHSLMRRGVGRRGLEHRMSTTCRMSTVANHACRVGIGYARADDGR